jgi:peptidyl-prolyl cis-trans isomerase B (cyclophilin B)
LKLVLTIMIVSLLSTAVLAATDKPKETPPETGRWVVVETNKGVIKFALYEKDAPITTKNFIDLVERKFYDGLTFHRIVPGFVVQGGDPSGDGTGQSDKSIKLEVSPKLKHDAAGVVAMARRTEPDSATCQFYITLGPQAFLDMQYAVFGRVTEGIDVVKKIQQGDVMKTVRIIPDPAKPKPAESGKPKEGSCPSK